MHNVSRISQDGANVRYCHNSCRSGVRENKYQNKLEPPTSEGFRDKNQVLGWRLKSRGQSRKAELEKASDFKRWRIAFCSISRSWVSRDTLHFHVLETCSISLVSYLEQIYASINSENMPGLRQFQFLHPFFVPNPISSWYSGGFTSLELTTISFLFSLICYQRLIFFSSISHTWNQDKGREKWSLYFSWSSQIVHIFNYEK